MVASAVTAYAAGSTCNVLELVTGGSFVFPSVADIGFLSFYPLVLCGLFVFVLGRGQRLPRVALLDGAVGSLGAGAVLAVLLGPLLMPSVDAPSLVVVVAVAYPLFDLLCIALVAGIAALPGRATGRYGMLLLLGLTIFALTDVFYAYQVVVCSHQLGTMLDAGWTAGICLTAAWANNLGRSGVPDRWESAPGALAVPAFTTTAAAAVLIAGTRVHVPVLGVFLAGATLLGAGFRRSWAFRQLVTLEEVRRQARTDELTGLPNRRSLYADVPERLGTGTVASGSLLLLDLDRFKEINDSLGHDAGDQLLVQIGQRFSKSLRPTDLIARIGGDEFALWLEDTSAEESITMANLLREALIEPFTLEGLALHINASAGIALYPRAWLGSGRAAPKSRTGHVHGENLPHRALCSPQRRSSVGTTQSVGCFTRASSFRWPKKQGS
ncbi:diguanylate cyclase (GGDEF)-like protein [Arthrobacter sp. B2I5]|nr:GGDEF domain-containing protein [Arthrobacter sp. B2I5]MDQ0826042.1 diguanylate cyclase (GGDEF)-like protein [Arthrobacter sp. B2I5]